MAVKINGINHCAISVADIEETIQWYSDVFGFTVVNRSEIPGAGIKVAHLQGVGFLLEVFEAPGANPLPEDRRVPNRDLMTHGNKHMSFGVPDGRKAKEELEAMSVEIAMLSELSLQKVGGVEVLHLLEKIGISSAIGNLYWLN